MELNPKKCFHIKYTRKKKPFNSAYGIEGEKLEKVNEIKDLGVILDHELRFREHIDHIVRKGSQMLGFIKRNTKGFKKNRTKIILFNALVRSHLEYGCNIWNPFYSTHSQRIENIQRAFTRHLAFLSQGISHRCSYEDRLNFFKLNSLANRRKIHDLTFLHKIVNNKIQCTEITNCISLTVPHKVPRNRISRTFHTPLLRTNLGLNSPIVRMYNTYNFFNSTVVNLDIFNDSLYAFRKKILKPFV